MYCVPLNADEAWSHRSKFDANSRKAPPGCALLALSALCLATDASGPLIGVRDSAPVLRLLLLLDCPWASLSPRRGQQGQDSKTKTAVLAGGSLIP